MKKASYIVLIALLCACIVLFVGCGRTGQYLVYGTFLEVSVKGAGGGTIPSKVYDMMSGYEDLLSPTVSGSDVNKINGANVGEAVLCSPTTMDVAKVALAMYVASDGAYDTSVYPLVRLWKFSGDLFTVAGQTLAPPSDEDISFAKSLVGLTNAFSFDFDANTVTKKVEGAMLDFGGIAKGYAVGKSAAFADGKKVLVNLGGNICCCNNSYTIGITAPRASSSSIFGSLTLTNGESISTSGDYQRYYNYDGKRYHHVLNPSTGYPSESGIISVSVVSSADNTLSQDNFAALGDAVSTAVMVLGEQKGTALLSSLNLRAVIIFEDLSYKVVGNLDFVKK